MKKRAAALIQRTIADLAPDPRTTIYEVDAFREGDALRITGVCSDPALLEELHRRVAAVDASLEIRDEVTRLPDPDELAHAIVTAATAPLLAGPRITEPAISQAVLGHTLTVLRTHGRWLQVRARDGYLGWTHRGYVRRVEEAEARAWRIGTEGIAALSLDAEIVIGGEPVIRLPWGARVVVEGERARLPDGRVGRAVGELVADAEIPGRFPLRGDAIAESALEWMGTPYLWGGITQWGADCSGFVQAVYGLHGLELPRDSDQQERVGERVEASHGLTALVPGDLLYFAESGDRVSHVAISLGGSRIVHSALGNGGVQRNDLDGDTAYERDLRALLVSVRRVISRGG